MDKKLYIKTFGCQMNVYDSMRIKDLLRPHGFSTTTEQKDADLIILNTCHIREKAAEKIYSELGKLHQQKDYKKRNGQSLVIVVTGCVAQAEGEEIFHRAPFVDIVVGPQSYHTLPQLIEKIKRGEKWAINLDFPVEQKFDFLPENCNNKSVSAFLSIQEGCDKFCNFCVVPYTRGAEYSRPIPDVYNEAATLAANGAKEIVLLGQNVTAYHCIDHNGKQLGLEKLIKNIATIDGIKRIRYMTSHPRDMIDEELFEIHGTEPKLMPFLHLPVQSGSNTILRSMNRKHDRDFYFNIIEKFRKVKPNMAFSSDIIVGYPGETDNDFEDTIDLVKSVKFAQCYSFKYSPRPGTPASVLSNQVPEKTKDERLQVLQDLLREQQQEFNNSFLNKKVEVLFEKLGKYRGQVIGKSEYMQAVFVNADEDAAKLIGQVAEVSITKIESNSLNGKIIK